MVDVAPRQWVEAAYDEQVLVWGVELPPSVGAALAMEEEIRGAERVGDGKAQHRAVWHPHANGIEVDAKRRRGCPWSDAAVPIGQTVQLALEAVAHTTGRSGQERANPGCEERVSCMRGIEDERAIVCGLSVAVDVAGDGRRIRQSRR